MIPHSLGSLGDAGFIPSTVRTVMGDATLNHNSNSYYGNPTILLYRYLGPFRLDCLNLDQYLDLQCFNFC